jgi:hypothetical protein
LVADPRWLPHAGTTFRRGVNVDATGTLTWAACNLGDTRRESIFLNRAALTLDSSDKKVATLDYGPKTSSLHHPVHVVAKGTGPASLTATDAAGNTATLDVQVFPRTDVLVRFKRVKSDTWSGTLTATKVDRLMKNLNYIYSYQGNFHFALAGPIQDETIAGLSAIVERTLVDGWGDRRDCGAQVTVFFVHESNKLGHTERDLILMEDVQAAPFDEMTLAHEMGHFFGLLHPNPVLPFNLMNQTAVGDRHRMKIFLTRKQIETITDKSKWNRPELIERLSCMVELILK